MIVAVTQADVLQVLGWAGLALLALVLLFAFGMMIAVIGLGTQWARKQFLLADAALAPLGQTPVGSLLHDGVAELATQVDQTSDPYVQMVHGAVQSAITGIVQAFVPQYIERAKTLVTPEQVQRFLAYMVIGAEELLDGVAASDDDIPTMSYGVPEPDAEALPIPEQEHIPAEQGEAS